MKGVMACFPSFRRSLRRARLDITYPHYDTEDLLRIISPFEGLDWPSLIMWCEPLDVCIRSRFSPSDCGLGN
jgi:hypothetical protein